MPAVPERLQRFYAMVRNAPTVVLLLGILLLGAGLFFVDGAFSALVRLGGALTAYIPGSWAALRLCWPSVSWGTAGSSTASARMEQEYAFRREVLERTGIVLVDKGCVPLPRSEEQRVMLVEAESVKALPPVLDVGGAEPGAESDDVSEPPVPGDARDGPDQK